MPSLGLNCAPSSIPEGGAPPIRVTFVWVCGLLIVFALGILWLGSLGAAIFLIYRAHGRDEVGGYVVIFGLVLVALGREFVRFVNRFYDWWLDKRVNAMVDNYQSQVSLEFSETFKRQLRSSSTFQNTVTEAKRLAEEVARKAWRTKTEQFAERIAQGDPLAVEVILKAIEKESERGGAECKTSLE